MNETLVDVTEKDPNIIKTFEDNIKDIKAKIVKIEADIKLKEAYSSLKEDENFKIVFIDNIFDKHLKNTWKDYNTATINGFAETETFRKTRLEIIQSVEMVKNFLNDIENDRYYNNLQENLANCNKELEEVNKKFAEYLSE